MFFYEDNWINYKTMTNPVLSYFCINWDLALLEVSICSQTYLNRPGAGEAPLCISARGGQKKVLKKPGIPTYQSISYEVNVQI